jgi:type I restriction enzyme R subunit
LLGYPPDMQMLATETVLKQAELIAGEIGRIVDFRMRIAD